MKLSETAVRGAGSFDGRRFGFCSPGCKTAFDLAPAEYAALAGLLPSSLGRLVELARNLWWTWHPDAQALFAQLRGPGVDPVDNPLRLLSAMSRDALEARARDPGFLDLYRDVLSAFDADLAAPGVPGAAACQPDGQPIAYFSAEFGIHSSLPTYSGGLGVLAGDIAKEASDLGVPLIGVGFMYPQGYFRQRVGVDGRQQETYDRLNPALAPVAPACTVSGQPCTVALQLPDRVLHVSVWVARVGRVRLYLMDTDLEANPSTDREIAGRLYAGDEECRLRQEIVLGIGGVRLLRALGIAPAVWHANEGHSAFMMVERLRELMEAGAPFVPAVERVHASTVFTTHTPVAAGHDAFPFSLIDKYLARYWPTLGLDREWFLALGAHDAGGGARFNMTALALRLSGCRTAVSRRHAEVSRRMWRSLWPGMPENRAPIMAVTNGVHAPSWVAPEMYRLYRVHLAEDWTARQDDAAMWQGVEGIPDTEIWQAHRLLKVRLVGLLRERARRRSSEGEPQAQAVTAGTRLDPDVLTLGFARRFATYKRAALVLRDPDRLRAILADPKRPVQVIFAGKAHPADEPGKAVLRNVCRVAEDSRYQGRIAFVEDYDMEVARHLVQGVDVWLNTPHPPLEASGTSGQKAALNGVPSLSVLDGWWCEAFDGSNGWAIGSDALEQTSGDRDGADADALYRLLESTVVPLYYTRDAAGVPVEWVRLMKRVISTIAPRFNARRLLKDYLEHMYLPAGLG